MTYLPLKARSALRSPGWAWSNGVLRRLTHPAAACWIFGAATLVIYGVVPSLLSLAGYPDPAYLKLASITSLGVGVVCATYVLSRGLVFQVPKITIDVEVFLFSVIGVFAAFAVLSWVTAEQIPLIAALQGADGATVAHLRESFLKGRGGWQSSFVYINAILSGALLPYCIAVLFVRGSQFKWWVFAFFMVYSISFMEKAFFLKAVVPIFYLLCQARFRSRLQPSVIAVGSVLLLLAFTMISRAGASGWSGGGGDFWSPTYQPGGALDQLVWRVFSVPLFSAVDAIKLWETAFNYPLGGATSSLVAAIFGLERIEFERLVFAYEWGQNAAGTGSANSFFLTEAFVNFSWPGVVAFSVVVGLLLRMYQLSRDEAFRSLWLLFCINLFSAGLIGILFSNGYLLAFLLALFVRMRGLPLLPQDEAPSRPAAARQLMPWEVRER